MGLIAGVAGTTVGGLGVDVGVGVGVLLTVGTDPIVGAAVALGSCSAESQPNSRITNKRREIREVGTQIGSAFFGCYILHCFSPCFGTERE